MDPEDRLLWIGLGAFLFFITKSVLYRLQLVQDLTIVTEGHPEGHEVGQETEEALKLETLGYLSESANFDLRSAALRLICDRSTRGTGRQILLSDLASNEISRRDNALTALEFLIKNTSQTNSATKSRFQDRTAFVAIVDCLCLILEEKPPQVQSTFPSARPTRPQAERRTLKILAALLPDRIPMALSAGLVSRWLIKYPFHLLEQDDSQKQEGPTLDKAWRNEDPTLGTVIILLLGHPQSRKSLRNHGLIGSSVLEERDTECEETAGDRLTDDDDIVSARDHEASRRHHEESADEQALRRRRREAMVLGDGDAPITRGNIIEPLRSPVMHVDRVDDTTEPPTSAPDHLFNRISGWIASFNSPADIVASS